MYDYTCQKILALQIFIILVSIKEKNTRREKITKKNTPQVPHTYI